MSDGLDICAVTGTGIPAGLHRQCATVALVRIGKYGSVAHSQGISSHVATREFEPTACSAQAPVVALVSVAKGPFERVTVQMQSPNSRRRHETRVMHRRAGSASVQVQWWQWLQRQRRRD